MRNKRLFIILSCLAFVAVCALSLNALFTVAEVEATFAVSSLQGETDAETCERIFDGYKGKSLTFFKTGRVQKDIASLPYLKVDSVQKKFPNKIVITLSERLEAFCTKNGEDYFVFDNTGFVLAKKSKNANQADGQPNVLIELPVSAANVGGVIAFEDKEKQSAVFRAAQCFEDFRNEVEKMYFGTGVVPNLYIAMRTGATLVLDYTAEDMTDKLSAALSVYDNQPEYQKLSGYIVESGDGFVWTSRAPL